MLCIAFAWLIGIPAVLLPSGMLYWSMFRSNAMLGAIGVTAVFAGVIGWCANLQDRSLRSHAGAIVHSAIVLLIAWLPMFLILQLGVRSALQDAWEHPEFPVMAPLEVPAAWWLLLMGVCVCLAMMHARRMRTLGAITQRGDWMAGLFTALAITAFAGNMPGYRDGQAMMLLAGGLALLLAHGAYLLHRHATLPVDDAQPPRRIGREHFPRLLIAASVGLTGAGIVVSELGHVSDFGTWPSEMVTKFDPQMLRIPVVVFAIIGVLWFIAMQVTYFGRIWPATLLLLAITATLAGFSNTAFYQVPTPAAWVFVTGPQVDPFEPKFRITLESVPFGTDVYINGVKVGRSPVEISLREMKELGVPRWEAPPEGNEIPSAAEAGLPQASPVLSSSKWTKIAFALTQSTTDNALREMYGNGVWIRGRIGDYWSVSPTRPSLLYGNGGIISHSVYFPERDQELIRLFYELHDADYQPFDSWLARATSMGMSVWDELTDPDRHGGLLQRFRILGMISFSGAEHSALERVLKNPSLPNVRNDWVRMRYGVHEQMTHAQAVESMERIIRELEELGTIPEDGPQRYAIPILARRLDPNWVADLPVGDRAVWEADGEGQRHGLPAFITRAVPAGGGWMLPGMRVGGNLSLTGRDSFIAVVNGPNEIAWHPFAPVVPPLTSREVEPRDQFQHDLIVEVDRRLSEDRAVANPIERIFVPKLLQAGLWESAEKLGGAEWEYFACRQGASRYADAPLIFGMNQTTSPNLPIRFVRAQRVVMYASQIVGQFPSRSWLFVAAELDSPAGEQFRRDQRERLLQWASTLYFSDEGVVNLNFGVRSPTVPLPDCFFLRVADSNHSLAVDLFPQVLANFNSPERPFRPSDTLMGYMARCEPHFSVEQYLDAWVQSKDARPRFEHPGRIAPEKRLRIIEAFVQYARENEQTILSEWVDANNARQLAGYPPILRRMLEYHLQVNSETPEPKDQQ